MWVKSFNLRLVMSAILFVRALSRSCQSFSITLFCTQHENYTFLHSITLFALNLGLIDMFLTNQNAEIVACISARQTGLGFSARPNGPENLKKKSHVIETEFQPGLKSRKQFGCRWEAQKILVELRR